jgi:hypothetical protein
MVVFPNGGGVGEWDAMDLVEQRADVNGLACCVTR